jgi:hypothetical protein
MEPTTRQLVSSAKDGGGRQNTGPASLEPDSAEELRDEELTEGRMDGRTSAVAGKPRPVRAGRLEEAEGFALRITKEGILPEPAELSSLAQALCDSGGCGICR